MVELSVLVVQLDGRCRVYLRGELDMNTAWRLRLQLETAWGPVEFDCSELTFIDSSGLAIWLERQHQDGALTLVNVSPLVQRALEVCGLVELFDLRTEMTSSYSLPTTEEVVEEGEPRLVS